MVGISRAGISDNKKVAFIKNEYNLQLSAVPYNSDPPGLVVYFPLYSNVWCTDCFSQLSGH